MSNKPANRLPQPPEDMSPAALEIWQRLIGLMDHDRLHQLDETALTVLATSFADYREAQRQIDVHGAVVLSTTGQPTKNPYALILKESFDRIKPLLAEFGLTPLARSKMKIPDTDETSELEI